MQRAYVTALYEIIKQDKNVISCLYSETPSKKKEQVTQAKEESER